MPYPYNSTNLLLSPCAYMYTAFEGRPFLDDYHNSRSKFLDEAVGCPTVYQGHKISIFILQKGWQETAGIIKDAETITTIKRLNQLKQKNSSIFSLTPEAEAETTSAKHPLVSFSPDIETTTLDLLHSLLIGIFNGQGDEIVIKEWTDRLAQRFEVSKKIYEKYQPGFRKGSGQNDILYLYGLSALMFSMQYKRLQNLKYLNVLLKINDLLTSVPDLMKQQPDVCFLAELSVICELEFIATLIDKKGLSHETV
jgi:hypothetical protein